MRNLADMLKAYRVARGCGLRLLAKEIGVSYPTLNRIERGASCDGDSLALIIMWMLKR